MLNKRKRKGGRTERQSLIEDIRPLAKELIKLQAEAKSLGLFIGDRELLQCPSCGLCEDVSFEGQLMVYGKSDPHHDTGLRFKELKGSKGKYICPGCGSKFSG